jgi:cell fate regulator YaaT (PSP1 superfamily)
MLPDGMALPQRGDKFLAEMAWGLDIGTCLGDACGAADAQTKVQGGAPLPRIKRAATPADLARLAENEKLAEQALQRFVTLLQEHGLFIKPLSAHYAMGRDRLRLLFSAPDHIDCRQVVGKLQRELQTRIEVWHAGVREETAMLGGFGTCGRALCCATWLHQFRAVNIRMAKAQDIPINPAAINGCCGRLKCCLRFEYNAPSGKSERGDET